MANHFDIAIIGTGIAANSLVEEFISIPGISIALINGGTLTRRAETNDFVTGNHSPLNECSNVEYGGTSNSWGGRCVDFNDIDFIKRNNKEAIWPITKNELLPYYQQACDYLGIGRSIFHSGEEDELLDENKYFSNNCIERWSFPLRLGPNLKKIKESKNISYFDNSHIEKIIKIKQVYYLYKYSDSQSLLSCKICIIAAGGLGSTKLLINSLKTKSYPALGKYYQGHISAKIANIIFNEPKNVKYNFSKDGSVYTRWRYQPTMKLILDNELLNTAFWIDNLPLSNPSHGSSILSFVYTMFKIPIISKYLAPPSIRKKIIKDNNYPLRLHIYNIFSGLHAVFSIVPKFIIRHYFFRRTLPGFFTFSPKGKYSVQFHAEQEAREENFIRKNKNGGFDIHYDFSEKDVNSIIKTHKLLDQYLQENNIGNLEYYCNEEQGLKELINVDSIDGRHQIGTTRMAKNKKVGVVDTNLEVFGQKNLFVISSSVYPTSSQANPTFLLTVLSMRLAELINNKF